MKRAPPTFVVEVRHQRRSANAIGKAGLAEPALAGSGRHAGAAALFEAEPKVPPAAEAPPASGAEMDQQRAQRYRDLSAGDQWRVSTFFSCYFLMTGLHGLHVVVGIALISWVLLRSLRGDFSSRYFTPVDLVGLYWHLVDMIWIFLFPLFYLIR